MQRKEGAENRKERMDKMIKSSLKTPPRLSAFKSFTKWIFLTAEEHKERMAQRTAKKEWLKMKNDETQITSAALCGFYLRGSPRLNLLPNGFF